MIIQGVQVKVLSILKASTLRSFDDNYFELERTKFKQLVGEVTLSNYLQQDQTVFFRDWRGVSWLKFRDRILADHPNSEAASRFVYLHPILSTTGFIKKRQEYPPEPLAINGPQRIVQKKAVPSTFRFVLDDPIMLVYTLQNQEDALNPMMVCAVDPTKPGGDFQRGAVGLETDLIIRSLYGVAVSPDYRQMVSSSLNEAFQSIEYPICGTNYSNPLSNEYGGLYLQKLAVFRLQESKGFEFHEGSQFTASLFTTASYKAPNITAQDKSSLLQYALHTRRKIETMFSTAIANGHDSLVIAAFGDPEASNHTASIFREVYSEFHGYFKEVVFCFPPEQKAVCQHFDREFSQVKEITVYDSNLLKFDGKGGKLCDKGGFCENYDEKHRLSLIHPTNCPNRAHCAHRKDDVHNMLWNHKTPCLDGSSCTLFGDAAHRSIFVHPPDCTNSACADDSDEHLLAYWHPQVCPLGLDCKG